MKFAAILSAALVVSACGQGLDEGSDVELDGTLESDLTIPNQNQRTTVDLGSWNVEWFGSTALGPTDEALQLKNVKRVLKGLNLDVVGLVEVVSETAFAATVAALPNRVGVLSTDAAVEHGTEFYSPSEQKVGLVFNKRFVMDRARLVLTEEAYAFAGRPPLEVTLHFTEGGKARVLVVLVVHLKAMGDAASYQRRVASAAALKRFLDTEHPSDLVAVVGDFNDDLGSSTHAGSPSPFAAFKDDSAHYRFASQALSDAHTSTTVNFSSTIDHHLVSDELFAHYIPGSAQVFRVDSYFADYGTTTSDHYPILTRYDLR